MVDIGGGVTLSVLPLNVQRHAVAKSLSWWELCCRPALIVSFQDCKIDGRC